MVARSTASAHALSTFGDAARGNPVRWVRRVALFPQHPRTQIAGALGRQSSTPIVLKTPLQEGPDYRTFVSRRPIRSKIAVQPEQIANSNSRQRTGQRLLIRCE